MIAMLAVASLSLLYGEDLVTAKLKMASIYDGLRTIRGRAQPFWT
jgi:hypothetical protein